MKSRDLGAAISGLAARAGLRVDRRDALALAGLCLVAVGAIVHARAYAGAVIDDAFITFRYSYNLVHGQGFSYNPGEHVEGTSSPLFALLMALPIACGFDPYDAAEWLGALAFAGCSVAAYLSVVGRIDDVSSRSLAVGAAAMVAASSSLAFHSQTGMETLPYACLVAFAFWLQLRTIGGDRPSGAWATIMGLAALARPEGFLFFFLLFGLACAGRSRRPGAFRRARGELLRFGLVFGPWLVFRRVYFGEWLPNTVLAKSGFTASLLGAPLAEVLRQLVHGEGTAQARRYFELHLVSTLLLAGTFALARARYVGVVVAALALACAGVSAWTGGDWMPRDRLLAPCIPPLAVGAALGLRGLFFHSEQRTRRGHVPSFLLSTAGVALVLAEALHVPARTENPVDWPKMREIGKRLAPLTRSDDLVATDMAGMLPYYWGARVLDMYGLCDPHIAKHGSPSAWGTGRREPEYVVARRPTLYAFNFAYGAASFYRLPAFAPYRDQYYLLQFPYGYLSRYMEAPPTLLVRKDRPEAGHLAASLGAKLVDAGEELRRTGFL